MANVQPDHLPEWQARLLARFFDGESGPLERRVAQLLLKISGDARAFAQELSVTSTFCRGCTTERNDDLATHLLGEGSLWHRIEQRIEAEERAALFLGPRNLEQESTVAPRGDARHKAPVPGALPHATAHGFGRRGPSAMHRPFQQIFLGTASGALTATIILFVTARLSAPPLPTIDPAQLREAQLYPLENSQQVALRGLLPSGPLERYRPTSAQLRVDWMRANGPLTLIQNPQGKSAIIWVQRRSAEATTPRLEAALPRATYVPPTVTFTGLDEPRPDSVK